MVLGKPSLEQSKSRYVMERISNSCYLRKDGNKYISYNVRILTGKRHRFYQIAKVSEMSREEAIAQCDKRVKMANPINQKQKERAFVARLKKINLKTTNIKCFRSIADAECFLKNLSERWLTLHIEREAELKLEIYKLILLKFILPYSVNDIINIEPASFQVDVVEWLLTQYKDKRQATCLHLTPDHHFPITQLFQLSITRELVEKNLTCFPIIKKYQVKAVQKLIKEICRSVFPNYPINVERFNDFFKSIAYSESNFKNTVIDDYLINPNTYPLDENYHKYQILMWWMDRVLSANFSNRHTPGQPLNWLFEVNKERAVPFT